MAAELPNSMQIYVKTYPKVLNFDLHFQNMCIVCIIYLFNSYIYIFIRIYIFEKGLLIVFFSLSTMKLGYLWQKY